MTIELPVTMERELRTLAGRQGRDLEVLVQEAVRDYLVASSITDLDAGDIAETQLALASVPNRAVKEALEVP